MSAQGEAGSASANNLSAVIEEEDLYDNSQLYASKRSGGTASASQTPTDESTSRRSSQVSESSAADAVHAGASTVPKKSSSLRRPLETGASTGVRQLFEKRRSKASKQTAPVDPASKVDKRSIFTLDHVRKIFGPQQQQQQQGSNSRRSSQLSEGSAGGSEEFELTQRRLSELSVDSLPAVFLAKYLGEAPAAGLFGVDSIRKPSDELVRAAGKRRAKTGRPLPIAQLTVLQQGVSVRPHPQSEGGRVERAFHAIDSVSYAAVDPAMGRIFCLVAMPDPEQQQQQRQQQKPMCHAFLCNSVDTAHRLVLAVTFAFESAASAATGSGGGQRTTLRGADDDNNEYQDIV